MNNKAVILCAGQGAQAVGMGRDLADAFPPCRELFARANAVLGYDLVKIILEGPETELVKSNHCQPAIFTVTAACAAALQNQCAGFSASAAAGLSLGEWTALYLAGAVSFEDGLRLLSARGRFMQEACEENAGGMLSVLGLEAAQVAALADRCGAEVANYNSPEQTVLSGRKQNILEAEKMAKECGAKRAILLNVAGAYHSSLMKSAADKLAVILKDVRINPPAFPVMANVTGRPHGTPEEIRQSLVRQVTSPVKWVDCIASLADSGAACCIECGPGRVLSGLVKRIRPQMRLGNVQDVPSLKAAVDILHAG